MATHRRSRRRASSRKRPSTARALEHLGQFAASNGHTNERFDAFLARDVTPDGTLDREPTEQMEIELYPMAELHEHALRGEIADAPSALAILLAAERLRSGR